MLLILAAVLAAGCGSKSSGTTGTAGGSGSSGSPTLNSITVRDSKSSVAVGVTDQFTATGNYSNGSTQTLTAQVSWSSSNASVATINASGLADAVSAGSATMQASLSGVNGTAGLTVTTTVTLVSISVTGQSATVAAGGTDAFTATGTYSDGSMASVTNSATWSSSNASLATINSVGLATGVAAGSVTIRATVGSIAGTANLTVIASSGSGPGSGSGSGFAGVLTQHNDNGRTGQNLDETQLTPANVNTQTFGKLMALPVDGQVYGQPLYVPQLSIAGATHNVVYATTENDSVFAFDADNGTLLWQISVIDSAHGGTSGETPGDIVDDLGCTDLSPMVGITSTPVINPASNTMYVEAKSKKTDGTYVHRLHALDITTGAEIPSGPAVINATVPGTSQGGTTVTFDPLYQLNRTGLLLANGQIYVGFGSHCDDTPYNGWIFAYDATALSQTISFLTTPNGPNGGQGALWLAGAGLAADSSDAIFTATGNGDFDSTDFGDTVLKLLTSGNTLSIADSFTPFDQASDQANDFDLGGGGVMLLPDQPGANPHEMVVSAKDGEAYLLSRDQLTANNLHYCSGCSSDPQVVEEFLVSEQGNIMYATPAYWNGNIYMGAVNEPVYAFAVQGDGTLSSTPSSSTPESFEFPGSSGSISANGTSNAILWVVSRSSPAILYAYDATNLANELWNSSQAPNNRDQAGADGVKFTVPTIANGKVYIGTASEVDVYGLF